MHVALLQDGDAESLDQYRTARILTVQVLYHGETAELTDSLNDAIGGHPNVLDHAFDPLPDGRLVQIPIDYEEGDFLPLVGLH